jgi:hypothetical protein
MRERRFYDQNVWSFGFLHQDVKTIREFVEIQRSSPGLSA